VTSRRTILPGAIELRSKANFRGNMKRRATSGIRAEKVVGIDLGTTNSAVGHDEPPFFGDSCL